MKKYLFSLVLSALGAAAWADNPVTTLPLPIPHGVTQVSATVPAAVVTVSGAATAKHGCASGDCCPQTKTVCVSQPATVVKTKVLYSSGCETLCHKGIFQFLKRGGDCDACAVGACGHSYVRRDLYKRVEKTECPSYKCVPTQVPVCATPCATGCATSCASGACGAVVVTPAAPATAGTTTAPLATLAITTPPAAPAASTPRATTVSNTVR